MYGTRGISTTASHDKQILEKISKPKCDFGAAAAAQNKTMNLQIYLKTESLLKTHRTKDLY